MRVPTARIGTLVRALGAHVDASEEGLIEKLKRVVDGERTGAFALHKVRHTSDAMGWTIRGGVWIGFTRGASDVRERTERRMTMMSERLTTEYVTRRWFMDVGERCSDAASRGREAAVASRGRGERRSDDDADDEGERRAREG